MLNFLSTLLLMGLLPILIPQAIWTRCRTPRLPEAAGPIGGSIAGREPARSLIVLGESTAAGVGAATHTEALTGQIAQSLRQHTGQQIDWLTLGRNGATAQTVLQTQIPQLLGQRADVVVIALGVNDTTGLRRPTQWQADLKQIVEAVRQQLGPVPILLTGIPPLGEFPALPQPLRVVMGLRASLLDRTASELAQRVAQVTHLPIQVRDGDDFATDGYHPGPIGYAAWGQQIAEAILKL